MATATIKIKGFNYKEQKLYEKLSDGKEHTIAEMAKGFKRKAENEAQAQSFVRNGLRRLIRDGWVEKAGYGTYRLTKDGKKWVKECRDSTASFGTKRGRKPKDEKQKEAEAKPKKKKATKKAEAKPKKKKAKSSKGNGMNKAVKAPSKVRKIKNREARKKVGPLAAKDKAAQLAAELAADQTTN